MTWDEALTQWEAWCRAGGHSERTIKVRRYQLRMFADEVGVDDPWQVTLQMMVTFLGSYDWSRGTRHVYRQSLRSLFAFAVDYGYMITDPTAKLPKVRVPPRQPRPAPDVVFAQALASADNRVRLILMLAAFAGLRRMEIAELRWEQVGSDHLRIVGKGDRVRVVPLLPALGEELQAERQRREAGQLGTGFRYIGHPDSPYLFPGRYGEGHMALESIGKAATEALGHGYTLHTLRHRFATKAYAVERDLIAVQHLLGHANIRTTTVYAAAPDGALLRAVLGVGGAS